MPLETFMSFINSVNCPSGWESMSSKLFSESIPQLLQIRLYLVPETLSSLKLRGEFCNKSLHLLLEWRRIVLKLLCADIPIW
jgi:hypothetical protein